MRANFLASENCIKLSNPRQDLNLNIISLLRNNKVTVLEFNGWICDIIYVETGPSIEKPSPMRRLVASDKFAEVAAGQVIAGLENVRFMDSRPQRFGLKPDQVSPIPTDAVGSWVFHHIGDVWEVAYLFTAARLALVGANEAFKKVTKKEIPDEVCFWASMITSVAVPSMLELNMMPLFGKNINPSADPADLFGVGIGALVIIAAHYASKYREPIKKLASLTGRKFVEGSKFVAKKLQESEDKIASFGSEQVNDEQLAKR